MYITVSATGPHRTANAPDIHPLESVQCPSALTAHLLLSRYGNSQSVAISRDRGLWSTVQARTFNTAVSLYTGHSTIRDTNSWEQVHVPGMHMKLLFTKGHLSNMDINV